VNGLIGKTLKKAKSEVLMALFVFSEQKISNILRTKKEGNSNFSLGILVEPKFAYRDYSELLDIWGLELRTETCVHEPLNNPWKIPYYDIGVPRLGRGDMLHHKFAVVDESTVILGSQNWSDSANTTNDENLVVISDPQIALEYKQEYLRLTKSSRFGPPKTLLSRIEAMNDYCSSRK
jgi:phosphatidylserine/phosphatidylglycerophosphate/cardiolipin synthase-like enzyme